MKNLNENDQIEMKTKRVLIRIVDENIIESPKFRNEINFSSKNSLQLVSENTSVQLNWLIAANCFSKCKCS